MLQDIAGNELDNFINIDNIDRMDLQYLVDTESNISRKNIINLQHLIDYGINISRMNIEFINIQRMLFYETEYDFDRLFLPTIKGKKLAYMRPDGILINFGNERCQAYDCSENIRKRKRYRYIASKIPGNWRDDIYSETMLNLAILWSDKFNL